MTQRLLIPQDLVEQARENRHGMNNVVYSPEGRRIATSDVRMNVAVFDREERIFARNYESINQKIRPTDRVRGLKFSVGGDRLYVAAGDTVHAVDLESGRDLWSYTPPRSWGFLIVSPIALAVAPNGDVAAAFDNGSIAVWNSDGEVRALWHDNDSPRSLFFLKDGSLLTGTDSFSLCAWDVDSRKKVFKRRLRDRVFGMAASAFATVVATRTLHKATIWDLESGEQIMSIPVGPGLPLVAFHPTRKLIALGSRDSVEIVDYEGMPVARYVLDSATAISMAFSADGTELAVGCSDDHLQRFRL